MKVMRLPRVLCSASLALLFLSALLPCAAQEFPVTVEGYEVLSHVSAAPVRLVVPLAQPYWAIAMGPSIAIADGSDPSTLVVVDKVALPAAVLDMDVVGTRLYVALGVSGMAIVDVGDPFNPSLLGSLTKRNIQALAVDITGEHVYCTNGDANVTVVNVKDPTRPKVGISRHYTNANFYDVLVTASTLIAAAGPKGVIVYSIEAPGSPVRVKRVKELKATTKLALNGKLLACTDDDLGLVLVNFPTWKTPAVRGSVPAVSKALDCAFSPSPSNLVVVAEGANGYRVVDVTDPDLPITLAQPATPAPVDSVSGAWPRPYLACGDSGLFSVDLTNPAQPVTKLILPGKPATGPLDMSGDVAFVGANGAVESWDFSDAALPVKLGSVTLQSPATDIKFSGNRLYVSCQDVGVAIYDATNPASLQYRSLFSIQGGMSGQVDISGNLMAVASGALGVILADVGNAAAPVQVGSWKSSTGLVSGAAFSSATLLWVMDSAKGLASLNVTVPSAPAELGKTSVDYNYGRLAVYGTAVYCAGSFLGLSAFDCSDPAKPDRIQTTTTVSATTMDILGTDLLLSDGGGGLRQYDLSVDPLRPAQTAYFEAPGFSWAAGLMADGTVALASREGGLWGLSPASCPGTLLLLPCEGGLVSPFHSPLFSWVPQAGAHYKVQLSTDPGFPDSDKTVITTELRAASWVPGSQQYNWVKKRSAKGKTIYWRVAYLVGSSRSFSEVRTVDVR